MRPVFKIEVTQLDAQSLKKALTDWFEAQHWRDVQLKHELDPRADEDASYSVVYEASFKPASADAARVEVWLTTTGEIAAGIDSCEHVARLSGVRNQRSGFAGGHEPLAVPVKAVLSLLELIALGQVRIRPTVAPVVGIVGSKAIVSDDSFALLDEKGYPLAYWLDHVDAASFSTDRQLVSFAGWR